VHVRIFFERPAVNSPIFARAIQRIALDTPTPNRAAA
jgi:hypothetical protein